MNIHRLARIRAKALAHLEALAGFQMSKDREEVQMYLDAEKAYRRAERDFQQAAACLTTGELHALGIAA